LLFFRVYVITFEVCHKHGTITQSTADTPQTSLHKHGTITQNTADTIQTSLHKHGTIRQSTADIPQTYAIVPCLCNEV
jgi:hypothetical protein